MIQTVNFRIQDISYSPILMHCLMFSDNMEMLDSTFSSLLCYILYFFPHISGVGNDLIAQTKLNVKDSIFSDLFFLSYSSSMFNHPKRLFFYFVAYLFSH